MCHQKRCKTCGNITWAGCGRHISQVKAGVPADQWCPGHDAPSPAGDSGLGRFLARTRKDA
jgi:hypothetical protein